MSGVDVQQAAPRSALTVIVCSRNRAAQLAQALPAVVAALTPEDELIVVDSASEDASTAEVAAAHGLVCVRAELPGLSRARNAGIAAARHDLIAFTDDDCAPAAGWTQGLRAGFADPQVGFVTGSVHSTSAEGGGNSVLERTAATVYDHAADPSGMGHGANMAFRAQALSAVGAFDEQLGAGAPLRSGEDADMLLRVLQAGWKGVYRPDAAVAHDQWRSLRETLPLRYGYGLGGGAFRMKAARRSGTLGRSLVRDAIWQQAIKGIYWALRSRDPGQLLRALPWVAGLFVGLAKGRFAPLDGDVFGAP